MSIAFLNRHVLEDRLAAVATGPGADHVAALRRFAAVSVLAKAGEEGAVLAALQAMLAVSVRAVGPFEWLVISETQDASTLFADLANLGAERVSLADQSDGRVLLRLSGPNVRAILAKCVAIDLHPDVFAEGHSANMLFCHVSANVARTGEDIFEIAVMRSYASFAFEELMQMGLEFGMTAGFVD